MSSNIPPRERLVPVIFALLAYIFFGVYLLDSFAAALAPERAGGRGISLAGVGVIFAPIFLLYASFLFRSLPQAGRCFLALVSALSLLYVSIQAFYTFPPGLDGAYYWYRYKAHPVYGRWDFAPASTDSFVFASACGVWFVYLAFPPPATRFSRIINVTAWIGGFAFMIWAIGAFSLKLALSANPAITGGIVLTSFLCFAIARIWRAMPFFIMAMYGLIFAAISAGLPYLYRLPPPIADNSHI